MKTIKHQIHKILFEFDIKEKQIGMTDNIVSIS